MLLQFIMALQTQADTRKFKKIKNTTNKWDNYSVRLRFKGSRGELILQQLGYGSAWHHRLRRRTGGVKVGCDTSLHRFSNLPFLVSQQESCNLEYHSLGCLAIDANIYYRLLFVNSLLNVLSFAQSVLLLSKSQVLALRGFALIGVPSTLF